MEHSVLSKGLTFVPTVNKTDEDQVKADCERFFCRLRLKAHFHDSEDGHHEGDNHHHPFTEFDKKTSIWRPPDEKFLVLDHYIDRCCQSIASRNYMRRPNFSNLTQEEKTALQDLKRCNDIIIKPADKGSAVVVWKRDLYIQEANYQLSDNRSYQHLDAGPIQQDQKIVKNTIKDMIASCELPPMAKHLVVTTLCTSRFYMLPKIHKPNNPGHPIVSACCCPTENISAYLDEVMAPFVKQLPTYVKDASHALSIFDSFTFDESDQRPCFLFTMDVKSLYTVIPDDGGVQALAYFFDQRTVKEPSTHTLVRLAELVLTLNAFFFDDQHYRQIGGVAMGSRMGPNYVCLFVKYIEERIRSAYTGFVPQLHKRYIDDIVGASSHPTSVTLNCPVLTLN